jgi:hypothetical protein
MDAPAPRYIQLPQSEPASDGANHETEFDVVHRRIMRYGSLPRAYQELRDSRCIEETQRLDKCRCDPRSSCPVEAIDASRYRSTLRPSFADPPELASTSRTLIKPSFDQSAAGGATDAYGPMTSRRTDGHGPRRHEPMRPEAAPRTRIGILRTPPETRSDEELRQ